MFLDRQDNRKEVEQAYRKQLKSEVDNKRSRIISNKNTQEYHPEKESFGLIANIEKEQHERKKKNEQYYDDLRTQMEIARKEKLDKEADKKRREQEEQNKIKQEQRKLQERYDEELKKQNKNKRNVPQQPKYEPPPQNAKRRRELSISMAREALEPLKRQPSHNDSKITRQKINYNQSPQSIPNGYQSNTQSFSSPPPVNLYANKIENETFNYVSRNLYKDNYYKELLGQRRRLEEQANQISQLNRIFNVERYKRREESRGLSELRNLEKMLDSKNAEYLDVNLSDSKPVISQPGKLKPVNKVQRSSTFSQKVNKDEWRKLD